MWLRENYPGKVISVDIEPRNHTSDNTYQRERRFKFYAKNGFSDTGWRVTVDGGVYVIMCSQPEPPSNEVISELKELILKLDTAMCPEAEIPVLFINTNIRLSIHNLHSHIYWED
ncbi:MAG: hypothetical protein LUD77_11520 [Clostridiales bacterium]|nr:hypothetical protein [Clostridiales bacterium]